MNSEEEMLFKWMYERAVAVARWPEDWPSTYSVAGHVVTCRDNLSYHIRLHKEELPLEWQR